MSSAALDVTVWKVENEIFRSNTYICGTPTHGHCILIDPGLTPELIDRKLDELNLKPTHVFCTHGHFDHVGSAQFFKDKYGALIGFHVDDVKVAKASNFLLMACKINARIKIPEIDLRMSDQSKIDVDGVPLRFVHVPGHTVGSCFIELGSAIFTGDSMYKNAVGLVDFPGENAEVLRQSLLKVWNDFPETHTVYPGHGGSGLFGEIKKNNQRLRQFLGLEDNSSSEFSKARGMQAFLEELQ